MVTLSCLIVVATLFSQVTSNIPASSTPKAIDVYFFYFIFRLFLIFFHHTTSRLIAICYQAMNHRVNDKKQKKKTRKTKGKNFLVDGTVNLQQAWMPEKNILMTQNELSETKKEHVQKILRNYEIFNFIIGIILDVMFSYNFVKFLKLHRIAVEKTFFEN